MSSKQFFVKAGKNLVGAARNSKVQRDLKNSPACTWPTLVFVRTSARSPQLLCDNFTFYNVAYLALRQLIWQEFAQGSCVRADRVTIACKICSCHDADRRFLHFGKKGFD